MGRGGGEAGGEQHVVLCGQRLEGEGGREGGRGRGQDSLEKGGAGRLHSVEFRKESSVDISVWT